MLHSWKRIILMCSLVFLLFSIYFQQGIAGAGECLRSCIVADESLERLDFCKAQRQYKEASDVCAKEMSAIERREGPANVPFGMAAGMMALTLQISRSLGPACASQKRK